MAQRALETLATLSTFLRASNTSLSLPSTSAAALSTQEAAHGNDGQSVDAIISDLCSLFTLLSKETTALSIAFAPPKESWDAVAGTARKLHDITGKAVFGVNLLRTRASSSASTSSARSTPAEGLLAKSWRLGILQVLEALKELVDTCLTIYSSKTNAKANPGQRKQILTYTSLVWKAVEVTSSLPESETAAFRREWEGAFEILQDAIQETEELTQRKGRGKEKAVEEDGVEEDPEDAFNDDDFDLEDEDEDELEEDELEVAKLAYQLMQLVKTLFKRLLQDSSLLTSATQLHQLHLTGQTLLSYQDDLSSSLYAPQSPADIRADTEKYVKGATLLIQNITSTQADDLVNDLAAMSIKTQSSTESTKKAEVGHAINVQWYSACGREIDKAALTLLDKL